MAIFICATCQWTWRRRKRTRGATPDFEWRHQLWRERDETHTFHEDVHSTCQIELALPWGHKSCCSGDTYEWCLDTTLGCVYASVASMKPACKRCNTVNPCCRVGKTIFSNLYVWSFCQSWRSSNCARCMDYAEDCENTPSAGFTYVGHIHTYACVWLTSLMTSLELFATQEVIACRNPGQMNQLI